MSHFLRYREAQELAAMGAKVLHPRCLVPARWSSIPVEVHNTFADISSITITRITHDDELSQELIEQTEEISGISVPQPVRLTMIESSHPGPSPSPTLDPKSQIPPRVTAVAVRRGVTMVTISAFDMWGNSGFLSRVFQPFQQLSISVDLVSTSQYAVCSYSPVLIVCYF